jgi:hypothetical protein
MRSNRIALILGVLATTAILPLVSAAENPPAEKPPAAAAPAAAPVPTTPPPVREESIYIPYTKLREVFEKEGRGVFLPYEKFQALWQAARDSGRLPAEARPPVDALLLEVENKATVSKDVLKVSAVARIEVLKEGWVEVPLRLGDVALTQAALDDRPARIVSDGDGYKLLIEKKGREPQQFTLKLEFAKAYTKAPGQNSVAIDTPQAPVSKWEVRIPESGVKVNIQPLLAATEVPPAAGAKAEETVVLAFVGAAPTVRIDWTPKAEGAKGLEALASVKVEEEVRIDEGVTRTRARLAYEISRAELTRLEVEVPADQKVVNVFDANVREWSVAPAEAAQKISAQLFEPAKQAQNLVVELEKFGGEVIAPQPPPAGAEAQPRAAGPQAADIAAPVVRALGVGRQQGVVVVQVAPGLRAEAARQSGLSQLDAGDLPPALAKGKWNFSYRYAALPFDLALRVEKVQPRILADSFVEVRLGAEGLSERLLTVYTIERAGVFRLEFDVPEGYDVRSVRGAQGPGGAEAAQIDSHHLEGEKKTRLVVNLSRKALGKAGVEVQLYKALHEPDLLAPTGKAAAIPLVIPRVAPAGVERETGRLVVYAPESLTVNPTAAAGLRSIPVAEALQGSGGAAPSGPDRSVLAFAYTQEPVTLALAAERRKPQVTVGQLLVGRIDSGVVKYESTLFYEVLYSGVKSLRLDVPKDLAADIRVVTDRIRRQTLEDAQRPKDTPEGYEAWSLAGEAEFMGKVTVRLAWERAIDKLDVGKSVALTIPRLVPRDVYRAWGQIVLAKAETIDVQESAEPGKVAGLRPIDPQNDLMPGASVPSAARAFEFHDEWALAVVATMYKLEDVKRTSIERALVRTVVTLGERWPVQALYRMRSARQRLLVKLPAGVAFDTEPLRLGGRPVPLERGEAEGASFFVPLVGQKADEPFLLELRYTVPAGTLRVECPAFPEEPAVQKVYLSVYLPKDWDYLGSTGPWTDEIAWRFTPAGLRPLAHQTDASLITGWVREGLAVQGNPEENFPTDGRQYLFSTVGAADPPAGALRLVAVDHTWLAAGVVAVILAIGVILTFTRAAVRLVAAGALAVLLVLTGVFAPTFARQSINLVMVAAIIVVFVIWVLWYVLWTRPRDPCLIARREAREAARLVAAQARTAAPSAPPSPPPAPPPAGGSEGGHSHA